MTFEDLKFTSKGGHQARVTFANGYGASVINDGYGSPGLYEIAVLDADGSIDYSTHITDDVLGYLDEADVTRVLGEIEELPKADGYALRAV
jgi:hypothetical protein